MSARKTPPARSASKASAKSPSTQKGAAKAPKAPAPAAKRAAASPKPAKKAAAAPKPAAAAKTSAKTVEKIQKTRVVVPMDVYEPNKDAIKGPFKSHELKWNFLGEGKGLYKRADGGVHCFTQFKDDGVHYSIWGDDKKAVGEILSAWRGVLGEEGWTKATTSGEQAAVAEAQEKESDALKLWRMGEPQRRAGEPDLFYQKRLAEWHAKKPA